jgi:hypothetical protein
MKTSTVGHELLTFGWREWVSLPDLGLPLINAKLDTGARTSALHAFNVRTFSEENVPRVEFKIQPKQRNLETVITCTANLIDKRTVKNSGGHSEDRWVIESLLCIGGHAWPIEITLTSRDDMRFRMLLGRHALRKRGVVDSARSYLVGKRPKKPKKDTSAAQDRD